MSAFRWDKDAAATSIRHLLACMARQEIMTLCGCEVRRDAATVWTLTPDGQAPAAVGLNAATERLAKLRAANPLVERGSEAGGPSALISGAAA